MQSRDLGFLDFARLVLDALDKTCTWAMDSGVASQIELGDLVVQ